jgi:RNA polymerase sigma-70 factor, sigma-B/F/G subfamily
MDDTKELILRAHNGDKAARDKLVLENIGLVYSVSRRFAGRGYELEDINQIGTIGLIKAIDKFDDSFDVRFSTYAVPMIAGEIKRFLRDDGMLKVSRSLKENGYRIKKASDELVSQNGREATIEELAAATELSVEDVVMALEANTDVESIYKTIYQNDGNEVYLVDKLSGSSGDTVRDEFAGAQEQLLNSILLEQLLAELDELEGKLIMLRYFKEMTQTQVADKLGISQVQVSRLEKKILRKLRGYIT